MPPTIAVAPCRSLPDYVESIRRVGATPLVLDPGTDDADRVAGRADGLLLTGGGDVDPALYGEPPHAKIAGVDPARDAYELDLIARLRPSGMPVFAICRGLQILNVALGGTLVQDIPTQIAGALPHSLKVPPNQPFTLAHDVWIDKDTVLARAMADRLADTDCKVNSRHHQAVKDVAPGLIVSATAPDGVIEAVEDPKARFCLGVQWHPENFWRTGEFRPLFERFIESCQPTR